MAGADVTGEPTEKVVILGGGIGGVSAAIALSAGNWQSRIKSITLYQQGWRLGGKGASGRGEQLRIEEHGLHIWFGFYENAFRMLRECHEELDRIEAVDPADPGRKRWDLVAKNMEDSFLASGPITLTDHDGCRWKPWVADFFAFDDDKPWDVHDPRPVGERPLDWSVGFFVSRCLYLAVDVLGSLLPPEPSAVIVAGGNPPPARAHSADRHSALGALERLVFDVLGLTVRGLEGVLTAAAGALGSGALGQVLDLVLGGVDLATQLLRDRADELLRQHDEVRRAWYVVDLALAVTRGVLRDEVLAKNDFSVVNHVDFRQWLLSHGAARESVDSALIRAVVYDLPFAYVDGDPSRPATEAGTALRNLMRTFFTYRGAIMWKMTAGMGDIVFAPLYELLHKRGVTIKFFHRVEQVHADDQQVTRIDIDVQATMAEGTLAQNLLRPSDDPASTATGRWPAKPTVPLDQPKPGAAGARDYESYLITRAKVDSKTLKRGTDFDRVVYAMPISTVPYLAHDLQRKWAAAVEHVKTVPTQALQLWLREPASHLSDHEDGAVVGGFTEPFDTWADMNHLVPERQVPGASTIAYFCNVLPDSSPPERGPQARRWLEAQDDLVRAYAVRFLREDIRHLWPRAGDPVTGALNWDLLVAPDDVLGEQRLDHQYLRANVEPSERYVLSVPGSSAHRIDPGDTGFSNLYAAGDWTRCIVDAGCVEAATISGLLAANAILTAVDSTDHVRSIIGHPGP